MNRRDNQARGKLCAALIDATEPDSSWIRRNLLRQNGTYVSPHGDGVVRLFGTIVRSYLRREVEKVSYRSCCPGQRRPNKLFRYLIRICTTTSLLARCPAMSHRKSALSLLATAALVFVACGGEADVAETETVEAQPAQAQDDHLAQATVHAEQAANHGGMGHAPVLVQHATQALTHAEAALGGMPNPHATQAVASLKEAIEHGDMAHAEVATGKTNEAITHLAVAGHVAQAMQHGQEAVRHGDMGHAEVLVEHAKQALAHAQAALEIMDDRHIQMAVDGLQGAVDHGGMGHADVATEQAKGGLAHLHM